MHTHATLEVQNAVYHFVLWQYAVMLVILVPAIRFFSRHSQICYLLNLSFDVHSRCGVVINHTNHDSHLLARCVLQASEELQASAVLTLLWTLDVAHSDQTAEWRAGGQSSTAG